MEGLPDDPVHRPGRGPRPGGLERGHGPCAGRALTLLRRRLVLVRHGRTADNAQGRIQGQRDTPLDDAGRAQAEAAGPLLAALSPSALLSSDLLRARDTAEPLARTTGLPLRLDARLRELDLGSWQGLTSEEARERFPEEHEAWRTGVDVPRGGGETYRQAGDRAVACLLPAVAELARGEALVAVTHGGTARGVVGRLLDLPVEQWWRMGPLGNTCCAVLVEHAQGWRLERHNSSLEALADPVLATR